MNPDLLSVNISNVYLLSPLFAYGLGYELMEFLFN
jgi:hypothetical protein